MNTWYNYTSKFFEIETIYGNTYFQPYIRYGVKDTNLCYAPKRNIITIKDTEVFHLYVRFENEFRRFYIYDICTNLSEEETYLRTLDLYEYLRLKYAT